MIELLPADVVVRATGGGLVMASPVAPGRPARAIGDWLVTWARQRPGVTFLAERGDGGRGDWVRRTYGEVLRDVEAIAGWLVGRGAEAGRPVMILSDNSVAAALVGLGAMHAGVPVSPVSPAYSLQSTSFERLRAVAAQLRPGFVFAEEAGRFREAVAQVVAVTPDVQVMPAIGEMVAGAAAADARARFEAIGPDTIAKVLFTSGSTGAPKGVVNTHRMLTANQESLAACWPFLEGSSGPVVVDWLPWSHTFGGNHNFHLILRNGGTLYIDRGRPAPGLIETTISNMAEVSPTLWFNVPRGFDQAVGLLEAEPEIAARVFDRLELVFYAAAALGPVTRDRLERVAARAGQKVFFTSAWGSTETSPLATSAHFVTPTTGNLGLPVPGVELKLAPVQDRLELRVRGASVTPGYWQPGGLIAPVVLDDEGFLPTGDAGRLVDEARPAAGIVFGGRLGENFKLSSGTWVSVAQVRLGLIDACAPLVLEAVIGGHDREALGALLFVTPAATQLPPAELAARLEISLATYNASHPLTSERISCAIVVREPLSLDDGETTDKAYTNQRRVLERRASTVAALFADRPGPQILRMTLNT